MLTVHEIGSKYLSGPDDSGDVWFAIKATITNNSTQHEDVFVTIQGVDEDGFELTDVTLHGSFAPGETKTLTDRAYASVSIINAIKVWQIKG